MGFKIKLLILFFSVLIGTSNTMASHETEEQFKGKKHGRFTIVDCKISPKHIRVVQEFSPNSLFEAKTALLLKKIYTLSITSSKNLNILDPLFIEEQELNENEIAFIKQIKHRSFIGSMEHLPSLLSTFSGRINLLVMLTEVHFRNDQKFLPHMTNLLLIEERRSLTKCNINAIETLLFFPLTFIRNTANAQWRLNQDHVFVRQMKEYYRNYLTHISSVSYRISFYRNIIFYNDLERLCPKPEKVIRNFCG